MNDMELKQLCNRIADLQREHKFLMKKRQTARAQCEASVRNYLGYQTTAPKEERERICALSKEVIEAVREGVPIPTVDMWDEETHNEVKDVVRLTETIREGFASSLNTIIKKQEKAAKELPVYRWAKDVKGLGELSLAKIVGEAGEDREDYPGTGIGQFRNPSCLWKWFCLHVDGGKAGQDAAHYRKSIMWNVSDALVKAGGEYYELYLERKGTEYEKAMSEGLEVVASSSKVIQSWVDKGLPRPSLRSELDIDVVTAESKGNVNARSVGHISRRAERYIEKRLLKNLWQEW